MTRIGAAIVALVASLAGAPALAQTPPSDADVARLTQTLQSPFDQQNIDAVVESLAAAGVVVGRNADLAPMRAVTGRRSVHRYVEAQARHMAFEIASRGGIPGALLNEAIPGIPFADAPDGVIPISAILAGYVREGQTFGARLSRGIMNAPDARRHALLSYPKLVIALFLADVGGAAAGTAELAPVPRARAVALRVRAAPAGLLARARARQDLCATVDDFLNNFGSELRDLLSPEDSGLFGAIGRGAAFALGLAADFTIGIFRRLALDNPAVFALRQAVGALSVLTQAASLINPWNVAIAPQPAGPHYGIDEPRDAAFTATVTADTGFDWPQPLKSCAALLQIELPQITQPANAEITWKPGGGFGEHAEGGEATNTLSEKGTDTYDYVTHAESSDDHVGKQKEDGFAQVTAAVQRPEIDKLKDLAFRFAGFPGLSGLVPDSVLAPIRDLANPTGSGTVLISYHDPGWTGTISVRRTMTQKAKSDDASGTFQSMNEWTLVFNGPGRAQARGSVDNTVTLVGSGPDCNILITTTVGKWGRRGGTLVVLDDGLADGVLSVEAEVPTTPYTQNMTMSGCKADSAQIPSSTGGERITFEVPRRGQTTLNGTVRKPLVTDAAKAAMGGKMQLEGEEVVTYQLVQTPRGK